MHMTTIAPPRTITVALVGNPNTGKSTLFNALCGVRQRVGNYPGVTVEKKTGRMTLDGAHFDVVDLPGTYSLAPRSLDEMVAVDVLLGRRKDTAPINVVLCIVDASNLERNLYLVSQVLELGLPVVVALNMTDVAQTRGLTIDIKQLSKQLGLTVVPLVAHRRTGVAELKAALAKATSAGPASRTSPFPPAFQQEVERLETLIAETGNRWPRYLVERLLLDTGGYIEAAGLPGETDKVLAEVKAARDRLRAANLPVPAVEAMSRYQWVGDVLKGAVQRPKARAATASDRVDRVLTHWFWGTLLFAGLMLLVFQSIFSWAGYPMDWIDAAFGRLGEWVAGLLPEGPLQSLLVDGVIAGVGGVLIFLPQIMLLFLFIAILEDCGYMARAAYLMDRLMSRVGLSGKSFIPLLSSFACAIPGIMAARVIENRRDRFVTILVAPLMSCSARLPVYALLTAAFIPATRLLSWDFELFGRTFNITLLGTQGLTFFAMYCVGIVAAIGVALVLKRTILRGATPPFIMELPSYKIPSIRTVLLRVTEAGWAFVKRAGTIILVVSILVWAAAYFPRSPKAEAEVRAEFAPQLAAIDEQLASIAAEGSMYPGGGAGLEAAKSEFETEMDHRIAGAHMEQSFLGRAGHFIEPIVRPLGWDWRIGCAAIASFPAREVIVGTLGVIYNLGDAEDAESEPLREKLRDARWAGTDRPVFNIPVALSIMVFFALCAQCAATLAVIRRETNSWWWPIFTFIYMTGLAYVAALLTYQIGIRLI
jgi:ferrous iron transport protein B